MKKALIVLLLFIAQNYLITQGVPLLGCLTLPFAILFICAIIAVWYFRTLLYTSPAIHADRSLPAKKIIGVVIGLFSILILWKPAMDMFSMVPVFYLFSPVNFLYYYLPVQTIAAVICAQIILSKPRRADEPGLKK